MGHDSPLFAGKVLPLIMGIVNATPDSFSGDGLITGQNWREQALQQACRMVEEGAGILDIGGESTRPGAQPVSEAEEIDRVVPLLASLHHLLPHIPLSIDTTKPAVAAEALAAGAVLINDVSGAQQSPAMRDLAARSGAYLIQMHNGASTDSFARSVLIGGEYLSPDQDKTIESLANDLAQLASVALEAGIDREKIILDPGIGFGKTLNQNLQILRHLEVFLPLGFPVLIGASRKSFIGRTLDLPPEERVEGTAAVIAICTLFGASILRVHDVRFMARVARMAKAIGSV